MNGLKRKTPAEITPCTRHSITRKTARAASGAVSPISLSDDDDAADWSQSNEAEDEPDTDEGSTETLGSFQGRPRRAPAISRDVKQRLLDEQISFIIITRDNNKPDPYGSLSTEYRPLPWPAVAKLYNARFGVNIGMAAMEKRARTHREAWLAAHLDYPRVIRYADKAKCSKENISRQKKMKQVEKGNGQENTPKGNVKDLNIIDYDFHAPTHSKLTTLRVGGWVPPDAVREQADLNNYFNQVPTVRESEQDGTLTIQIEDVGEKSLGAVEVSLQHLRKSSTWVARELACNTDATIKLIGTSAVAVNRYLQCISLGSQTELPTVDFGVAHLTVHEPINWDFASLVALYTVAAQFEDRHVQELIIARWHAIFLQDPELEIDLANLIHLFHSTSPDDPARGFWASALVKGGLAMQVVDVGSCHSTLVAMLVELIANEPQSPSHGS
jgi:hypothetical protein